MVGLVTLKDVRKAPRGSWENTIVEEIMTPFGELATLTTDDDGAEALDQLMQRDVRQLPVMRDGKLVGLLRRRDVIRWLQVQSEIKG
ncbi:MAG: hypothetical protein A2Y73_08430 [Chloroflexi bacterium RBG_13_56_8]|nr:MAG: hypothetical protein A2Y73_08430 [Chloroflexi bacterium RBG_13_56_8]